MVTISGVGIAYLLHLNQKLFKKRANSIKNLTFRYQVSENVRSFEILVPMLIMLLLGCLMTVFVYLTMAQLKDVHIKALIGASDNIIIDFGGIVIPSVLILCLRDFRNKFFNFCKNSKQSTKVIPLTKKQPDDVTNFYFKQISLMWK
uniref:Uncharacterized protein n=1 Tax=Panagrolaimus sp. PS1159 TaxID=55785 RepID=A0AC35G8E3_9BILA